MVACSQGGQRAAEAPRGAVSGPARTADAAQSLRQDMRKLWSDHVIWTRDYIIAAAADPSRLPVISVC